MPGEGSGRRYDSARAVTDDLSRYLEGQEISARPVSPPERARRWCRRRPAVAALGAALALTLCGGFVGMFCLWRHAESERSYAEAEKTRAGVARAEADVAKARAEADFQRLSVLLGQLIELNAGGPSGLPKVVSPEYRRLLITEYPTASPRPGPPPDDRQTLYFHLETVDHRLSESLSEQGPLGRVEEPARRITSGVGGRRPAGSRHRLGLAVAGPSARNARHDRRAARKGGRA